MQRNHTLRATAQVSHDMDDALRLQEMRDTRAELCRALGGAATSEARLYHCEGKSSCPACAVKIQRIRNLEYVLRWVCR